MKIELRFVDGFLKGGSYKGEIDSVIIHDDKNYPPYYRFMQIGRYAYYSTEEDTSNALSSMAEHMHEVLAALTFNTTI